MIKCSVIFLSLVFLLCLQYVSSAANLYDGAKPPDGAYFFNQFSFYSNDTKNQINVPIRLAYYSSLFVGTVSITSGGYYLKNSVNNESSLGIGDVYCGVGSFLPINIDNQYNKIINILPMLFVKFPLGTLTSGSYASKQFDITAQILFNKITETDIFVWDGAAKYTYKCENTDLKEKLGNELSLESVIGFNVNDRIKLGPSVVYVQQECDKLNGKEISGSNDKILSAGIDYYMSISAVNINLTYLRDLYVDNSKEGNYFQIRMSFKLWYK